ncbi:hypothetical protein HPB47_001996 [Ixodes persulcatus]|uniref:Uncharacterized protein n=1 Tax=Ixodes persulcatus TaxID=34615 RepID=A0AC60PMJ4_IXOPE|nr:hypothetical protein HPB47_001996 [Ixodes persulcatus]
MVVAGVPMQPPAVHVQRQPQPIQEAEPPDSHEVVAERILRYLEDHQPPLPDEEDQRRADDQASQEDEDDPDESDTRRQAIHPAGPPHPPVRPSRPPPNSQLGPALVAPPGAIILCDNSAVVAAVTRGHGHMAVSCSHADVIAPPCREKQA